MKRHFGVTGGLCALLLSTGGLWAETIDSGYVENTGTEPAVVFSTTVSAPAASWIRLNFEQVLLSGEEGAGTGSYFVITSTLDSAVQTMHASHVAQWSYTSAYFNGDAVQFELIAYPGTGLNRVVIGEPTVNEEDIRSSDPCADQRILSHDPRVGRTLTQSGGGGCTAFLIDDANHCLLSAGHCWGYLIFTVEFNVPLSDQAGNIVHPPPEDQYAVDREHVQKRTQLITNDWCYFACFPNSNTGLTPFEAQGEFFRLASTLPEYGDRIRITGYGITTPPISNTWNRVQKTDAGSFYFVRNPGTATPEVISTGITVSVGNSGSPIFNHETCTVVGIVADGGCAVGSSLGSAITNADLQAALANPIGLCVPDCNHNGIPDTCDIDCGEPNGPCDVPGCGHSVDCSGNGIPDECEPDCNNNGVADSCDILYGTSTDCSGNGVPDECEPDCNNNSVPDDCDIAQGPSYDCNCNGIPDECDVAAETSHDCNGNGVPDECEQDCNYNGIPDDCDVDPNDPDGNGLVSPDCNHNAIPDECETDCNDNGVPDSCDVDPNDPDGNGLVSPDCNHNAIPDECEVDCNDNGVPDSCDVDPNDPDGNGLVSPDCNGNGVPDECETWRDCNQNGVPDQCDIADATSPDCNANGIPDECDIGGVGGLFVVRSDYGGEEGVVDQYDSANGAYLGGFVGYAGDLFRPLGMTFHTNGSLLVGDEDPDRHTIRRHSGMAGQYLGDFVTTGAGGLYSPWDMTFGPDGELYVANVAPSGQGTTGILEYNGLTGESLGTFATAELVAPYGLTFGPNGNLFVCDHDTAEIVEFNGGDGTLVGVFASPDGLYLDGPSALAFHGGNLFVADAAANDIVVFNGTTGALVSVFIDDVGGYGAASLMDLKFGPDDNLYVSHSESYAIYKYDGSTGELLAELPESDYSYLKPFRLAFRPAVADCNGNGIPEACEPADWDEDGDVDLADFAGFQGCFAQSGAACRAAFDRAAPCDAAIDMYDLVVFAAQCAGPIAAAGGGGDGFGGGGGGEGSGEEGAGGGMEAPQPPAEPWTYQTASLTLELQPLGGGAPVTVLAPNTTYEVHYHAGYQLVNGNTMFSLGVAPPDSNTDDSMLPADAACVIGLFQSVDGETEWHGVSAPTGYPDGECPYQLSPADFWIPDNCDGADDAGSQGHLCNFTTQSAGDLNVYLHAWWLDPGKHLATEASKLAAYTVNGDAGNDDGDTGPAGD